MPSSRVRIESTCSDRSATAPASRRRVPPIGEDMLALLSSAIPATLRLSLASLVLVGLAHTEGIERPLRAVQPSWVAQLALDGTPHEGVLGTTQDVDYYRIEVTELTEAVIHSSSELDIEGVLFDSRGREVVRDDDGGEGRNFRIVAFLNAGDYYLRIGQHSFGPSTRARGEYLLHATGESLSPAPLPLDGSTREGVIEPEGDATYFRIELTELTETVIHTNGGLDTIGALLDSEGRVIVSNDDGGEGRNFRLAPLLWPGKYFVRVTPWVSASGSIETGSYSLHAEGTPASIARLPLDGSSKQGVIESGEDADYFRIEAVALTEAAIGTSGGSHVFVTVLDADGREIMSEDGDGRGSVRLTALLQPGTYYVRVALRGGFRPVPVAARETAALETGGYDLRANGTPLSPPNLVPGGTAQGGFIESGEDAEYFRIVVSELTEAVIFTSGGLDTVGVVLDSEGKQILSDDDSGSGGNFRIATLLWPGEYFVRVTPWVKFSGQFDTGGFDVHAEGRRASPMNLSLNGPPHDGVIGTGNDEDYYRITVTEPTAAVIYTTGNLDTAGVLLGTNGSEVAFNDDGGERFINFRIAVILLRPDEYFLQVFSSSGTPGSYTLHAQGDSDHQGPVSD